MKKIYVIVLNLICFVLFSQNASFVPGKEWKDTDGVHINAHGGGIIFSQGRYYWYGEFKTSGLAGNTSLVGVSCYSSSDLYNWKNEGVVLKVEDNPNSEISKGCIIERPKVVFNKKTRQFVMWFHLELKGKGYEAARAAVAVSNNPRGPFEFKQSFRPNQKVWPINFVKPLQYTHESLSKLEVWSPEWISGVKNGMLVQRDFEQGQMSRDMTVFVDDDEKAYLLHSSEDNLTLHVSELTDDYLDFTQKWSRIEPAGHNEAPTIFKKAGYYYMITSGCTGWEPNAARSFRSQSIWGPWESLGNPCVGVDSETTFRSQSTYVLAIEGKKEQYVFLADRWKPSNPVDGTYVWLPIQFNEDKPFLKWIDEWSMDIYKN